MYSTPVEEVIVRVRVRVHVRVRLLNTKSLVMIIESAKSLVNIKFRFIITKQYDYMHTRLQGYHIMWANI